jgi:hypothetical protein
MLSEFQDNFFHNLNIDQEKYYSKIYFKLTRRKYERLKWNNYPKMYKTDALRDIEEDCRINIFYNLNFRSKNKALLFLKENSYVLR